MTKAEPRLLYRPAKLMPAHEQAVSERKSQVDAQLTAARAKAAAAQAAAAQAAAAQAAAHAADAASKPAGRARERPTVKSAVVLPSASGDAAAPAKAPAVAPEAGDPSTAVPSAADGDTEPANDYLVTTDADEQT